MSHYGALIKALDLALVLNISILLWRYFPAFVAGMREDPDSYANKLILGILVGWGGSWLLYANLTYAFWHHDFDPTYSVAAPAVRLSYILLTLLGTTFHLCASFRRFDRFWPMVGCWTAALAALISAAYLVEVGRPWAG